MLLFSWVSFIAVENAIGWPRSLKEFQTKICMSLLSSGRAVVDQVTSH